MIRMTIKVEKADGIHPCDLVENRLCKRGNVIAAWNFEVDIFISIELLQGGLIRVLLWKTAFSMIGLPLAEDPSTSKLGTDSMKGDIDY